MEKRILIAAVLSAILMAWYAQTVLKWQAPTPTTPAGAPTPAAPQEPQPNQLSQPKPGPLEALPHEETVTIESSSVQLEIGMTSAAIRAVVLKQFLEEDKVTPVRFGHELPLFRIAGLPASAWHLKETSPRHATFEIEDDQGNAYHIYYEVDASNNLFNIKLEQEISSQDYVTDSRRILSTWTREDYTNGRSNQLEASILQRDTNNKAHYTRYIAPLRDPKDVPRGTMLLSLAERFFCQSIKLDQGQMSVKMLPSNNGTIAAESVVPLQDIGGVQQCSLKLYVGPRDYFHLKQTGFEQAFPIGVLGQIGLMLLLLLGWLAGLTHNYGVAIILFSLLITLTMAPFTLVSLKSMKKMQELKPQVDKLMAKHKDDPKHANREVFALYKTHRVSPLSGCLPILLQLPIFFALFQAISHYVALRGQSFLWIADLSLPDRLAKLPIALPLLGQHLNLLPIIMAAAMFVQTKLSQSRMASGDTNPMASMMSGPLMSVIFGIMFYQMPAGLVLYWLMNSLVSLGIYRLAK